MTDPTINVRRIYEEARKDDGARILVDRLWPRGVSKERAHLDEWMKDIAPSTELRQWYSHDPAKFDEFSARYRDELGQPAQAAELARLRELARKGPVTLLTASKAVDISEATVIAGLLRSPAE